MFQVFWKGLFSFLLAILLIANIAMTFNMVAYVSSMAPTSYVTDWSNRYLGFSSFIDFMRGDNLQFDILNRMQSFMTSLSGLLEDTLNGKIWSQTNLSAWDFVANLLMYGLFPFIVLFNVLVFLAYLIVVALFIIINISKFMGGFFSKELPQSVYAMIDIIKTSL